MSTDATATPSNQRAILITGASSGIGRALAIHAAARGFAVLAIARRDERLRELAKTIRAAGGRCETLTLDVTANDAPQRIVASALHHFGRIDVVVNNAGVGAPGTLLDQSDAAIDAQWQLHVAAPLRIARAALAPVRATRGGFVFVGSGLARVPAPGYGAYCAAKAAVRAAAIQLRRELRREGIFVTYVDPGAVATEFQRASGVESSPSPFHVQPDGVAERIVRGIERRASRVNAVAWQTVGTVFGEWFPSITDLALDRIVAQPRAANPIAPQVSTQQPPSPQVPTQQSTPTAQSTSTQSDLASTIDGFNHALEPVARRMERVNLTQAFVRAELVPGATIELNDLAMRWAGMPNKNERAAMREVLDALTTAGYLQSSGEETWTVLRAAD